MFMQAHNAALQASRDLLHHNHDVHHIMMFVIWALA